MKRWASVVIFTLLAAGCMHQRVVPPSASTGPKPDSNFILTVYEVVETPEEDVLSYTRVYIDGHLAGQTTAGPKSSHKNWETKLEIGNHLVHLERWAAVGSIEPVKLSEEFQPRERFIRVETGKRTMVWIKFFDRGRKHIPKIIRESLFLEE